VFLPLIKKLQNIINKVSPVLAIALILIVWEILSITGIVPKFMLPSPFDVVKAFFGDFILLMEHAKTTLAEAFLGLAFGIIIGFIVAVVMDRFMIAYKAIYPVLVITQTVPTVAIAPLLVLWLGYGILPKITLIIITSFFPITIGLLDGFRSADQDALNLMKAMGANRMQRFIHIKLPSSLSHFFAGLRISVSYSIIGAVVAEWLGGFSGLGVYMTRVRKSYAFDKMFAVIFFISFISLILMVGVTFLQKTVMPWEKNNSART
jgi:ABC-type nitrate/sulfonate/bicarbonate transport system permease component